MGQSAVIQLEGWTWEDMALLPRAAMQLRWPRSIPENQWWSQESAAELSKSAQRQLDQLEQFFKDARAYLVARDAEEPRVDHDSRYEAMREVLDGRQRVVVSADRAEEIQSAVGFGLRHA